MVEANLRDGRMQLLFVADEISSELRRIVEFLNEQMRTVRVLAIEIKQFSNGEMHTLVPSVIGDTGKSRITKGGAAANLLSEEEWIARLAGRYGQRAADAAQQAVRQLRNVADRVDFTKSQEAFFVGIETPQGERVAFFVQKTGHVSINLGWLRLSPAFAAEDDRRELLERIRRDVGVTLTTSNLAGFPAFSIEALADERGMNAFLQIVAWVAARLRAAR